MKAIITDIFKPTREELDWLAQRGVEVITCPDNAPYSGDPAEIQIVMCEWLFSNTPIEQFTNLRYIQLFMAGFEHMPMEYIRAHNIEFHNARDVYSVPIAEFGIGSLLCLYKQLQDFQAEQAGHVWNMRKHLLELYSKRVLIVGAGSIGAAFAKRFRGFECHVTGLARTAGTRPDFDEVRPMEELDAILPESDIVVLCLPNNADTYHIMNGRRFAAMKQGAFFVNIARGPEVDEAALTQSLQSGHLGGAVLDVFEHEPLPDDSPLWDMKNVLVTPHTSFAAEYNQQRIAAVINRNLEESGLLKG